MAVEASLWDCWAESAKFLRLFLLSMMTLYSWWRTTWSPSPLMLQCRTLDSMWHFLLESKLCTSFTPQTRCGGRRRSVEAQEFKNGWEPYIEMLLQYHGSSASTNMHIDLIDAQSRSSRVSEEATKDASHLHLLAWTLQGFWRSFTRQKSFENHELGLKMMRCNLKANQTLCRDAREFGFRIGKLCSTLTKNIQPPLFTRWRRQ